MLFRSTRIPGQSSFGVGERVAVSLRPERASLHRLGDGPDGHPSIDGRLEQVTYLGNALIYMVALDWMRLEVRTENHPGASGPAVGDEVTVSWEPGSVSVVGD